MNALEKSEQLALTGTDEEIVAVLRTLTARDIPIADVSAWLRDRQLWIETPEGSAGSLYQVYAATENAIAKAGIAELYASVFRGQAQSIRTSRPDIAIRVAGVMQIIKATIDPTGEVETELYALAGGRPWSDVTPKQLAEQRADREKLSSRQELHAAVAARRNRLATAIDAGEVTNEAEAVALFGEDA